MVLVFHLSIICDHSSLLFLFSLFEDLHYITFMHFMLGFFCYSFQKKFKKMKEKEGKMCFALFFLDLKSRLAILSLHNMFMYLV